MNSMPNLKQLLQINNSTDFQIYNLSPGYIRSILQSGKNLEIQDIIDLLLKSDAHFLGKYQDRLSIVRNTTLNVTGENTKQTKFIKENLDNILSKSNLKFMLDAIFRRFSVLELNWELKDGKYIISDLKPLPQRSFEFKKKTLKLYDAKNDKFFDIPKYKTVQVFSPFVFDGNITSITEIIAILIVIKYYALQKDFPRFNELFALPLRLGIYQQGTPLADIEYLEKALKNLGSDAVGVISGLTDIKFIQPNKNDPKMFTEIINICNSEISKAITGQSGTSENGSNSSYASLKVLNGIREDIVQDSLDLLSNEINEQIVKPLIDFNFPNSDYPVASLELPKNISELLDKDKKLKELGVKFKKDYFIKRYNLDENDFEIFDDTDVPNIENNSLLFNIKKKTLSQEKSPFF